MHLVRKYNPFKRGIGSESPSSSTRRLAATTTPSGGASVGLHPVETNVETASSTVAGCIGKRSKSVAAEKELQHLSNKIVSHQPRVNMHPTDESLLTYLLTYSRT